MGKRLEDMLWLAALGGLIGATQTSSRALLAVIGFAVVTSLAAAIPLHFWRAWRKFGSVPNRRAYAVWVGLESLFTIAFISGCVYMVAAR